jgi:Tol biopolymer transport system component
VAVPADGEQVIDGLSPASHVVALGDLAQNCVVTGDNPSSITVTANDTATVAFAITCTAPEPLVDQIAFTSTRDGNAEIYVMRADGSDQRNLTQNPATDRLPSVSPDGRTIAFISDRRSRGVNDLYAMNSDGSGLRTVYVPSGQGVSLPLWSPDGQRVAFREQLGRYSVVMHVVEADGTGLRDYPLQNEVLGPVWSPDGHQLAFSSTASSCPLCVTADMFVINLDGTGLDNLTHDPMILRGLDWSPDGGRLAFASRSLSGDEYSLLTVDPSNRTPAPLGVHASYIENIQWAPDGSRLVFDDTENVFVVGSDGNGLLNLTTDPAADTGPVWSPDGSRIAFTSTGTGDSDVFVVNPDGSGLTDLTNSPASDAEPAWGPAP